MNNIFSLRILSLFTFFIFSTVNASAKYPETVRFPKGLGPVQFFETPTRYIVVDSRACGKAKLCTSKVLYYQIDKKSTQPLVLTGGSTINQGTGYMFIDPRSQKRYVLRKITRESVFATDEPGRFYITDPNNKVLVKEETRFSTPPVTFNN